MMNLDELPLELNERQALEIACSKELSWCTQKLLSQVSLLIECEKQLIPWIYMHLRASLKDHGITMEYLDGRSVPSEGGNSSQGGGNILRNMIAQLTWWVRNSTERKILVLPHLDLLVSQSSQQDSMTMEAREIIPLLYENPRVVFLGFRDPNFSFSKVIANLFPLSTRLLGIDRSVLSKIILQREARKFPKDYNFFRLYQYVSGLNPVRIRQILSRLSGMDFPSDDQHIIRQLREMTAEKDMEIPHVSLETDIGGYAGVKKKLREEILSILEYRASVSDEKELKTLDSILPKGMIFYGPPGTGKTFFAKAMASALNATITIVSGPELKSMWVGQSEENIRKVFFKARQAAPSIIVFDEIDSFASSRSQASSNQVQHSMVNQLLTEMDGFRKEELVFVIGTTNFVSSLDPALVRPGRFEMKIEIPYPGEEDRFEILKIYDQKLGLNLSQEQIQFMAHKSGEMTDPMTGSAFTGDHLYSASRWLKRVQVREKKIIFDRQDLYLALRGGESKLNLTDEEQRVIACHEAGHAIVSLFLKDASPVERISIDSDIGSALGYIKQSERKNRYVITKKQILADLVVLMGGREAENLIFRDISVGSENDIHRANQLVEEMVGKLGMSEGFGVRVMTGDSLSAQELHKRDLAIGEILERARQKAKAVLEENQALLRELSRVIVEEKVLERQKILEITRRFTSVSENK